MTRDHFAKLRTDPDWRARQAAMLVAHARAMLAAPWDNQELERRALGKASFNLDTLALCILTLAGEE